MTVPALRFPEFVGEWEEKRIGDIAQFKKGKGISKADIVENGALPCVRYGELYTTYGRLIEEVVSFTNVPIDELVLSEGGEILIPASGETSTDIATATVLPFGGVAIGGDLNIVETYEDRFFVATHLSGKGKKHLARMAQGNSVVHLYKDQIASTAISIPTLPEQKQIAAFLGVVDAKIAALRARVAGLERYKRGLMQALFSQTLRFAKEDGTAFPDWEEKRLGEVAEIIGGGTPDTNDPENWNGSIVWFTPSEIKAKYLTSSVRRISERGLLTSSAKMLPIGALVLSTRATVGDVGIATEACATNQGFQSLVMKGRNLNEFWYYWLKNNKKALLRRSAGSTFLEIGKSEVQKLSIAKPHPDEQAKIAYALSAMDDKIAAVRDQVAQMEAFKKGLLQQMFV